MAVASENRHERERGIEGQGERQKERKNEVAGEGETKNEEDETEEIYHTSRRISATEFVVHADERTNGTDVSLWRRRNISTDNGKRRRSFYTSPGTSHRLTSVSPLLLSVYATSQSYSVHK